MDIFPFPDLSNKKLYTNFSYAVQASLRENSPVIRAKALRAVSLIFLVLFSSEYEMLIIVSLY